MNKFKILLLTIATVLSYNLNAQVAVSSDGSSPHNSAMLEIKSTAKGLLLPRMTKSQILDITSPAEGLVVFNLESHKLAFFNGTNWKHTDGTIILAIGDYYQGGVVYYLDGNGGGLVCAVSDQDGGSGIQWYNGTNTITEATAYAIGTGQANTNLIISNQGVGSYAATVCDNYTVGAYSDWFLPSTHELWEMCINQPAINLTAIANGGTAFASAEYWSSTEGGLEIAQKGFGDCMADYKEKSAILRVRAVRSF